MRTVIHCAPGSIIRIPALFEGLKAKRVILISDKGLLEAGIVDQIVDVFRFNAGSSVALAGIYTDIAQDASCESVNRATAYAREIAADAILAVGGGSAIDASKGVKYALQHGLTDIADALQSGLKLEAWPDFPMSGIPHIGVPTTAGTGAEASPIGVFLNEKLDIKSNLISPGLDPDIAVLDANLTLGLPAFLTSSTGMDALTHALEAVTSPVANPMTDAHAFAAAQLIVENLPLVIEDGSNIIARSTMLQASSMAIDAFFGALNAIPVHNCAHAFGAMYHIPHGDANAALLPVVMEAAKPFYLGQGMRLAKALNLPAQNKSDEELVDDSIAFLKEFQKKVGATNNFSRWNVKAEDKEEIAYAIASDPAAMFFPMPAAMVDAIVDQLL